MNDTIVISDGRTKYVIEPKYVDKIRELETTCTMLDWKASRSGEMNTEMLRIALIVNTGSWSFRAAFIFDISKFEKTSQIKYMYSTLCQNSVSGEWLNMWKEVNFEKAINRVHKFISVS